MPQASCKLMYFVWILNKDWLSSQIVVILNNIKTKIHRKPNHSDSRNNISATFFNWNLSQRTIYLNRGDLIIKKLKWRITDLFT